MKILAFTNIFPSALEPTRGVFNRQWFSALSKYDEVGVVCPLPWWNRLRTPAALIHAPEETIEGMPVVYPTYWSIPGMISLHPTGMTRSVRRTVQQVHREFPFDAILAAWACPDAVAAAAFAKEAGVPLIVKVLGSDINVVAENPRLRPRIVAALQQASSILAVSQALGEKICAMGDFADKVVVRHNAVNGGLFYPREQASLRAALGLPLDKKLICYAGNFRAVKGTDILIEAMGMLKDREDIHLALVGSGPLEENAHSRLKELGMEDRVMFCGRQPHEKIAEYMAACDIFCLPSRMEGCPNVVLEALASGRPVVATKVGGVPELINKTNGLVAEPENPTALAEALRQAADRLWDPQALRNTVEFLSWDTVGLFLHELIGEGVSRKNLGARS